MDELTLVLRKIVDRFLNHTLRGAFRIGIYGSDGRLLARSTGRDDPFPGSEIPAANLTLSGGDHTMPSRHALASHSSGPVMLMPPAADETVFAVLQPVRDMIVAGIRLSIPDAPSARWLLLYAPSDRSVQDVLGVCELASELLRSEYAQNANISRLQHTVREQETIIDHISDGLLVMDRNGILKYCNVPASQILKISINASIGRPIREVLDFELALGDVFEREEGYTDRELQIESPTLNLHLIDTAIPIRNKTGEMVSVVNTFRKIERVKALSYRMTMDRTHYHFADIQGESDSLRTAVSAARKAARSSANIVLHGESGTGKELFAQAIHAEGDRAGGPFIALNCAALPRDLVESELFGYTSGSFTGADRKGRPGKFELASGGTLFLDEIADMPLDVQVKLLRVLQERRVMRIGAAKSIPVDVRVIAASNQRLADRVKEGAFREDLYFRLNVIEIAIPPLRERKGDILFLLDQFLHKYGAGTARGPLRLSPGALQQLKTYHWPGNVRELQNIVERLAHLSEDEYVEHIPSNWFSHFNADDIDVGDMPVSNTAKTLAQWEKHAVRVSLAAVNNNVTQAAKILGISRPTLYAKMKRYGIRLAVTQVDTQTG